MPSGRGGYRVPRRGGRSDRARREQSSHIPGALPRSAACAFTTISLRSLVSIVRHLRGGPRLRSRQARSPFYPRSTSQGHLNSRRRRRGDFLGARHAGLRIGCIFCLAPPRFAESPCRNIEYFCLRKALRNQQVVGSSPTAGSRNSTTHATASTTLDSLVPLLRRSLRENAE